MYMQYQVGDVLARSKAPFMHRGIYVGESQVFHNTPFSGEHISSLQEFADDCPVTVIERHSDPVDQLNILHRISAQLLAPRTYVAAGYNCEHSVNRALGRAVESPQLQVFGLLGALGLLALLSRKKLPSA